MDYLGVILEKGVTRMDPIKIAGIDKWQTPKNVTEVRRAVGFFNFYRPFIKGFAHIARPLHQLTRKNQEWRWGQEEQKAFDQLKARVTAEPVLAHANLQDQFELEVDASGYAVGAVLLQRKEDSKKHPIGYYSATLNEAQWNYDIYDLELLAIVMALKNWRPLLAGSPHKIIIYSDHLNLQYWKMPQKISRRVAREVLELSKYDFEIRHIPGKQNGRADALSRWPDYDTGENDNEGVVVLLERVFVRASHTQKAPPLRQIVTQEEMSPQDPVYEQNKDLLKPWIDAHRLKKIEGTWYKDGRRVVTGGLTHHRMIISAHHDSPVHGHPGINKTSQLLSRRYWWPNMRKDVLEYVKGCAECQRNKINTQHTKAPLQPIFPQPEAMPFETVALDFITKLPKSQGYNSILTVTDHDCSKVAIFIPCKEAATAEETAGLIIQHVFPCFGLPHRFISDRDPKFASRFVRGLCKGTGTSQNISTVYHPRMDGQSERTNQWLEQYLRFWINERQDNWHSYLPLAEFAHNNWPNETTGESPFFILYGFNPRADWINKPSPIPQVALHIEQFKEARRKAQELMMKAQQSWIKHKDTPKYHEGDLVWLEGRHLRTNQPAVKLAPKRHGPFPIIQVMSPVNYRLKLPTQWSIHDVFHIDLLTPYRETELHGANYPRPPPDLIDNQEEYEIEKILDSRQHGRGRALQYLVKWKGYPDSDNEWVGHKDVHAPEAIREFKYSQAATTTHIRAGMKGECPITSSPHNNTINPLSSMSNAVDSYYLGSPECIFGAELDTQLITCKEARELCAKKYIRPHIKDEDELAAPLTEEELARVREVFPDLQTMPVLPRPLSPVLRYMSDPDGVGAEPDHQTEVQALDDQLWEAEGVLRIPPRVEGVPVTDAEEGQSTVEGGTIRKSCIQEKRRESSPGSTAPASTPATRGPWSRSTSLKDWYPDEHPFIRNERNSDDPNETPYTLTTTGYPLYKKSYMPAALMRQTPIGFKPNRGAHYINYPIQLPGETSSQQAQYTQAIMAPNPLVVVLRKDSDKVFSKPLYASPVYRFEGKPIYKTEELDYLKAGAEGCEMMDRLIKRVGDLSLTAEVHRFRIIAAELDRMEQVLVENEEAWGQLAAAKLGAIRRLEMADTIERINARNDGFVDDALRLNEEILRGCSG